MTDILSGPMQSALVTLIVIVGTAVLVGLLYYWVNRPRG